VQAVEARAAYAITDAAGRTMASGNLVNGTLSVAALPVGAYALQLRDGDTLRRARIVVEH